MDECLDGSAPVGVDRVALCRVWDGCYGAEGFFCADLDGFAEGRPGFLPCVEAVLGGGCVGVAFDVIGACFWEGPPRGPGCGELCEARALCGVIGEGERLGCVAACAEAVEGGGVEGERQAALLRCGAAGSCEALGACEAEQAPGVACPVYCGALAGCGIGDGMAGCEARCGDEFFRARQVAARACVAGAGDCEGVAACVPGEAWGCAERCDRVHGCGLDEAAACLARCDDEQFGEPALSRARVACTLAAPLCDRGAESVRQCGLDARATGGACLGWCRAETGCGETGPALVACLAACGEGLSGVDGERFAAARACLEESDPDDCGALARCLPPAGAFDCGAACAARRACGLAGDDCVAACAADPLARLRAAEESACLAGAADCAAVAACAAVVPDEAPGAEAVCAVYAACGFEDDFPCANLVADLGRREGFLACLVDAIDPCPADPFAAIDRCRLEEVVPGFVGCEQACRAQARCEPGPGTIRGCVEQCVAAGAGVTNAASALVPCGAAASCDEWAACAAERLPERACGPFCAALDGCGLAPVACVDGCGDGFYRDRQVAWRACVAGAGGDCDAIAACDPGDPGGCDAQCARLALCARAGGDCLERCDDEAFADPALHAQRLACTMAAPLCHAGADAMARCRGAAPGGGACLGWCRAATGCDGGDAQALADCLVECGRGFAGDAGVQFDAARGCLEAAGAAAGCDVLDGCVADVGPVGCDAWCGALEGCGLAPEDCAATCAVDPLARLRAARQGGCVAAAGDCATVGACLGAPVVEVGALCARWDDCGLAAATGVACPAMVDAFGLGEAGLACLAAGLVECPVDRGALVDRCLEAERLEPAPLPACRRLCDARGRCGASARECVGECHAAMHRDPFGVQGRALGCHAALTCGELEACLRAAAAEPCGEACAAAVGCGAFDEVGACLDACGAGLVQPWVAADQPARALACLDGLDPVACAAGGEACVAPVLDCEAMCRLQVACGPDPEGFLGLCVQNCRQRPEVARLLACMASVLRPPDRCFYEGSAACLAGAL